MEENYWTRSMQRRLSRRRLLRGLALGGAGAALLSSSLGCQQEETSKPQAGPTASSQPKSGGTLVHWNAWNPPTLDPILNVSTQSQKIVNSVYNGLLRFDFKETDKVIPDLAEKWEVSPDGLSYKFFLRKDVQWHDGKPFTAADVQSTYDRMKDKTFMGKSGWALRMAPITDSWKTIDDYTWQLNFKMPAPYILNFLASGKSVITPKHIIEKEGTMEKTWVGTGPFKLIKYEPGAMIELVKNPNFWRKGLPYLDGIKRPIIQDRAAQVAAIASGQTMLGLQWPAFVPSEIELIKKQMGDKVRVIDSFQNAPQKIQIQNGFGPTKDARVRRAIFLAIDRWEINDRVFEGTGEVGGILDSRVYGDWALPLDEVQKLPGLRKNKTEDLAEAKRLLADAGYPNGLELLWKVRNTADYIPTAQVAAAQLEKIGIKSTIKSMDASAGQTELRDGDWHLSATGGNKGSVHALEVLAMFFTEPTASYTVPGHKYYVAWDPKEYVDKWNEAMNTLDMAKAKKLAHDMQRYLLTKDCPYFQALWISSPVVVATKLRDHYPAKWGMEEGHDHTIEWLDS